MVPDDVDPFWRNFFIPLPWCRPPGGAKAKRGAAIAARLKIALFFVSRPWLLPKARELLPLIGLRAEIKALARRLEGESLANSPPRRGLRGKRDRARLREWLRELEDNESRDEYRPRELGC